MNELFDLTLKRELGELEGEYGEYIPADAIRKKMRMSPMQFIDLMNSGKGPVTSYEEDFREHNPINGPYFKTGDLASEFFTVNVLDWLAWQKARVGGSECLPSDAALEPALAAKNAELEQARAELAALKAELEQARAEMSTLREELAALEEARQGAASPEGHGLCSLVIMMRREGKTEEEIAAFLSNDGKWCSAAQIGALLYLKEGRVSKDAMQKHGQRLLGTA